MPCVTVPLNLRETGGARLIGFDFQLRPVGCDLRFELRFYLDLRFKDFVS
jgi:hypothetical protein